PRFTNPALRGESGYRDFLRRACESSLTNCQTDHFDLVMLHNPDEIGYTSEAVWKGMNALKEEGLSERLGIAPGPANGFTLDLLHVFENFGEVLDWAMIILNPLEPWPGQHVLDSAVANQVDILTRVVDYGGHFLQHNQAKTFEIDLPLSRHDSHDGGHAGSQRGCHHISRGKTFTPPLVINRSVGRHLIPGRYVLSRAPQQAFIINLDLHHFLRSLRFLQ
ncbi:aldo/keto reductase, partial [bacterium]|nr:aldo/keto reductase [bacterium]